MCVCVCCVGVCVLACACVSVRRPFAIGPSRAPFARASGTSPRVVTALATGLSRTPRVATATAAVVVCRDHAAHVLPVSFACGTRRPPYGSPVTPAHSRRSSRPRGPTTVPFTGRTSQPQRSGPVRSMLRRIWGSFTTGHRTPKFGCYSAQGITQPPRTAFIVGHVRPIAPPGRAGASLRALSTPSRYV